MAAQEKLKYRSIMSWSNPKQGLDRIHPFGNIGVLNIKILASSIQE